MTCKSLLRAVGHGHAQPQPFELLPLAKQVLLHAVGITKQAGQLKRCILQRHQTSVAENRHG